MNNGKKKYTCVGGPWDGKAIWMMPHVQRTCSFKTKEYRGSYKSVVTPYVRELHWVAE